MRELCEASCWLSGSGSWLRILGSWCLEFDPCLAADLTPGGVDSACHPSEVSEMSSVLVSGCSIVAPQQNDSCQTDFYKKKK